MVELLAYIGRFVKPSRIQGIKIGMFCFKPEENLLMKSEKVAAKLTPLESKLLKVLAMNINQTVTREKIEQELWRKSYTDINHEQSLNNYVAKLRKYLLEDETLKLTNIPKTGYRLSEEARPTTVD